MKGQGECYVIHKAMVNILMRSAVKPQYNNMDK